MILSADKEYLLKILNGSLDGHAKLSARSAQYCDGIKHVRELLDHTFGRMIQHDEMLEFCVSIICSIQAEEPRFNRLLSDLEQGILAASYLLYTAMHPIEYAPASD